MKGPHEFSDEYRSARVEEAKRYQELHNVSRYAACVAVAKNQKCKGQTIFRWLKAHEAATALATTRTRELAAELGVTSRTLRFYEEVGLIKPARRGQTRLYTDSDRRTILKILRLRDLGFGIAEIQRDGVDLAKDPERLRAKEEELLKRQKHLSLASSRVKQALAAIADD